MLPIRLLCGTLAGCGLACACMVGHAQFRDDFDAGFLARDADAHDGWACFSGDGEAVARLLPGNGFATLEVDATRDRQNVWWALIRRKVSAEMDLGLLAGGDRELRVEARIRTSHAPRRVNLHFNTQRTKDFHSHLMEYDLPTAGEWHTISMTTRDFDARPGDQVFAQLALMDWGTGQYRVDVDYLRADLVDPRESGPDLGTAVPYHPPVPPLDSFTHALRVSEVAMIDSSHPDENHQSWSAYTGNTTARIVSVDTTQVVLLRWDISEFKGQSVEGGGVLTLTTHALAHLDEPGNNLGLIRIVEIVNGDPTWIRGSVTFDSFCQGLPLESVINPQTIIDVDVNPLPEGQTHATISQPVLQRLINGRTQGLAILPLGRIHAAFRTGAASAAEAPTLRVNFRE